MRFHWQFIAWFGTLPSVVTNSRADPQEYLAKKPYQAERVEPYVRFALKFLAIRVLLKVEFFVTTDGE